MTSWFVILALKMVRLSGVIILVKTWCRRFTPSHQSLPAIQLPYPAQILARLHSTFVPDNICFLVRPKSLLKPSLRYLTILVSNSGGVCGWRPRRTPTSNLPDNLSPSEDLGTLKCSAAFLTHQPSSCMASTAACSCASSYLKSYPLLVGMYFFGIYLNM